MIEPSSATQALTRQILALESIRFGDANIDEALAVCDKLRAILSRLSGRAAYSSLLQRAVTLAQQADPSLRVVAVQPDGALTGLDKIEGDHEHISKASRVILVAHLLELLAVLIGEPLMRRLALDAWPEVSTDGEFQRERTK